MSRRPESAYDVIVAGGGAGRVGAALGARAEGAKVLLVEKYGFLGGAATNAQVLAFCGFFLQRRDPVRIVGGVADLVLEELRRLGLDCKAFRSPTTSNWIILLEPEAVKLALDRVLLGPGRRGHAPHPRCRGKQDRKSASARAAIRRSAMS